MDAFILFFSHLVVCRFFLGFIAKVSVKMSLSDILMVLQKRCLIPVQSSTFGDDIRGKNLVCVRLFELREQGLGDLLAAGILTGMENVLEGGGE